MKNKTKKCDERLVARVKAMVDEDVEITIEKIAQALTISSGSVSNILKTNSAKQGLSQLDTSYFDASIQEGQGC